MIFPQFKFFWTVFLFACGMAHLDAKASSELFESENKGTNSVERQMYIFSQANLLQNLLGAEEEERTASNLGRRTVLAPFDFLTREDWSISLVCTENGDEKIEKAKQLVLEAEDVLNESDSRKGKLIFYFKVLFWNALTEQIENPYLLIKHDWHKVVRDELFKDATNEG